MERNVAELVRSQVLAATDGLLEIILQDGGRVPRPSADYVSAIPKHRRNAFLSLRSACVALGMDLNHPLLDELHKQAYEKSWIAE